MMFGNMTVDDNTVKFTAHYDNLPHPYATFQVAMGTTDGNGKLTPLVMATKPCELESRYNQEVEIPLGSAGLTPDTYQLIPMARCTAIGSEPADGPWHTMTAPEKKVIANVTADGITSQLACIPNLEIERAYLSKGTGIPYENNEVTLVINNKGHEYSGELSLHILYIGNKTLQEALDSLSTVTELGEGTRTGGYLRAYSQEELPVTVTPVFGKTDKGNFLVLLYEAKSNVFLGATTFTLINDYKHEFFDLEVLAYTITYDSDGNMFYYDITIRNNDEKNDWPKYENEKDMLYLELYNIEEGESNFFNDYTIIPKGEERHATGGGSLTLWNDPIILTVYEKLHDEHISPKLLFEISMQPNETVVYPSATGIRTVPTETTASPYRDLQGRQLKGRPTLRGIYIKDGKKIVNTR